MIVLTITFELSQDDIPSGEETDDNASIESGLPGSPQDSDCMSLEVFPPTSEDDEHEEKKLEEANDSDLEIINPMVQAATERTDAVCLDPLEGIPDISLSNRTSKRIPLKDIRTYPEDDEDRLIWGTCGNFLRYELALEAIEVASVKVLRKVFEKLLAFERDGGVPLERMSEFVCGVI